MKINSGTDLSTMFSNLTGNNGTSNILNDYKSIKNGSYGKLMKAYYGKNKTSGTTSSKTEKNDAVTKNLSQVQTSADDFKKSVDSLKEAVNGGDSEKVAKAATEFADKYNALISAADKSEKSAITKTAQNMINQVGNNLKLLSKGGISLSEKGKMSVDETKVKENVSSLKSLFGSFGSFGDQLASKASSIQNKATSAINTQKTYTSKANYNNSAYSGNLFDSIN